MKLYKVSCDIDFYTDVGRILTKLKREIGKLAKQDTIAYKRERATEKETKEFHKEVNILKKQLSDAIKTSIILSNRFSARKSSFYIDDEEILILKR